MIDFVALALYCALMGGTPGPNNVMLTASSVHYGFARTIPHMLGIAAGHVLQVLITCLSLGEVFLRYPATQTTLRIVGFLYLMYLSYRILGSKVAGARKGSGRPLYFLEAVMFQFVNPKAWVFVTTVAALFLPQDTGALLLSASIIAITAGIVVIPCIAVWAGFGQALRRFLERPLAMKIFNITIAAALVATAFYMLISSSVF